MLNVIAPSFIFAILQDVTEAAQHDRAVAAMANELRQLVDTANAPIFGIDVNGNVNEWNNKTAEITGFSKKEAFDKPLVSTFIVPSLRNSVQEVLDKALHGNETSNYELEFETKSKEIRYLLVNATTRRDAENNIVGGEFHFQAACSWFYCCDFLAWFLPIRRRLCTKYNVFSVQAFRA